MCLRERGYGGRISPLSKVPGQGVDTKLSEGYTDALAKSIHACFALHGCSLGPGGTALPQDAFDDYVVDF